MLSGVSSGSQLRVRVVSRTLSRPIARVSPQVTHSEACRRSVGECYHIRFQQKGPKLYQTIESRAKNQKAENASYLNAKIKLDVAPSNS